MTTMLKKISAKTLKCQKIGDGFKIFARVGMANLITTDKGESYKLTGMFRAVVDSTGEVFEGISAFLPGGYDALFASQLRAAQDENKSACVEISAHFAKHQANNPMGCEWIMTLLDENIGGKSALDALQSKALPSPKEEPLKLAAPKKKASR